MPNTNYMGSNGSITNGTTNLWSAPSLVYVTEQEDSLKLVYEQVSMLSLTIFPAPPPERRVFKIIYSVQNGQWHKSEPIFGKFVPATNEYFEFEDEE